MRARSSLESTSQPLGVQRGRRLHACWANLAVAEPEEVARSAWASLEEAARSVWANLAVIDLCKEVGCADWLSGVEGRWRQRGTEIRPLSALMHSTGLYLLNPRDLVKGNPRNSSKESKMCQKWPFHRQKPSGLLSLWQIELLSVNSRGSGPHQRQLITGSNAIGGH